MARKNDKKIALVPTMGNLHRGHLDLIKQAREVADVVVATIFVNRLQFGLNEDWDKYPRTLEGDISKLTSEGCDILFCPDEHEIYPNGMDAQARVLVPNMMNILCGASRPGHFEGVATVVSKLFNIAQPDFAIFGNKDFQQLALIRKMAADLCMPIEVIGVDISREEDGLARSSRNHFILDSERPQANQLHRSLLWVVEQLSAGATNYSELESQASEKVVRAGFRQDYIKICESNTLDPAADDDKALTVLGAMYTKQARLIDNVSLQRSV